MEVSNVCPFVEPSDWVGRAEQEAVQQRWYIRQRHVSQFRSLASFSVSRFKMR
jgi:hypothetical protein